MKMRFLPYCLLLGCLIAVEANEPNNAVALAIENRLLRSDKIRSHSIRADFKDGIVTLTGTVDNLEAAMHAVEAAQAVRGVRSVVNMLRMRPFFVDDAKLKTSIEEALHWDIATEAWNIVPEVKDGEVTLAGTVDSLAEKRVAEHTVASVLGVKDIDNQLTLDTTGHRFDYEINNEVEAVLQDIAILDDTKIDVSVDEGRVVLTGSVASLEQRRRAVEAVSIAGVKSIDAKGLQIDWTQSDGMQRRNVYRRLTDERIVESIKRSFQHHPYTVNDSSGIVVRSTAGDVRLSGYVSRPVVKETAEQLARDTVGVGKLSSYLRIAEPDSPPSDIEIAQNASRAVERDAYLEYAEIIPRVRNGHVNLYGMVDSEFEKRRAGRIAGMQPGVVHVANHLTVSREWKPKPDEVILRDIEAELELLNRDPTIDVAVHVEQGRPILSGKVDTWHQWQALNEIAVEAGGRDPQNMVKIHYVAIGGKSRLYAPQN